MKLLASILFVIAVCRCAVSGDSYTWADWNPTGTNVNSAPFNWAFTTTFTTQGGWYHRMQTNVASETLTLPLGKTNPPGTYYLWQYVYSSSGGIIRHAIGDGSTPSPVDNLDWTRTNVTSTTSFSNLNLTITNVGGVQFDYILGAFYVTTNAYEAPYSSSLYANSGTIFRDYAIPAATNVSPERGNLIPNSSLELGFSGGWTHSKDANTTSNKYAQRLIDAESRTGGYDGDSFADIFDGDRVRSVLNSPVIRLRGGREQRLYTLSYYAKGSGSLVATLNPVLPQYPGFPTNQITYAQSVSESWTRYSTSFWFSPSPTREMCLDFSTSGRVQLDAMQLEEGSLTDWYPRKDVEFAAESGRVGNAFGLSETPDVFVKTYSKLGATAYRTLSVIGRDINNRTVVDSEYGMVIPPGLATNRVPVTITNRGTTLLTFRMSGDQTFADEMTVTIAALPSSVSLDTNSVFGVHGMFDGPLAVTNRLLGFSWSRSLSPGRIFRWSLIEPTTNSFVWDEPDYKVASLSNQAVILGNLQLSSAVPSHAATNGMPRLDRLSNYVYQVVSRYKDRIRYWEGWNELNQADGLNDTQRAAIEDTVAVAVKAADPTCYYLAFGGASSHTYMSNTFVSLSSGAKAAIDGFSVHLYPADSESSTYDDTRFQPVMVMAEALGKPVWNSESGGISMGMSKGDRVGWTLDGTYVWKTLAEDVFQRAWYPVDTTVQCAVRTLGWGMERYFFYDFRVASYQFRNLDTTFSAYDYDDSLRPDYAAYAWVRHLIDPPTSRKRLTNAASSNIEAYLFGSSGNSILFVWSKDKTNRIATTTNTSIGQFDQFGNQIATNSSTLRVTRHPWSWFSGTLSTNQMEATFTSASFSGADDTNAPNVSVDVSPYGAATPAGTHRFKWTAVDDTWKQTTSMPSNVLTRTKLVGRDSDWGAWGSGRSMEVDLTPGSYQLAVQSKDFEGRSTNTAFGPTFQIGAPSATAGSVTVGTLHIGP